MKKAPNFSVRGSGGGYQLSHFPRTIGVVRLNISVRNGKRWIPHAITTLMRLRPLPFLFCCSLQPGGPCIFGDASTDKPRMAVRFLLNNFYFLYLFSSGADSFEGLRRGGRLVCFDFSPFSFFLFGLASLGKRSGN